MPYTFLVGGARSGKSSLAVRLASAADAPVVFIATAEGRDDDMARRILAHRAARPPAWETIDSPRELFGTLARIPDGACAIVDCLTLWLSNVLEAGATDDAIADETERAASLLAGRAAPSVVVSNEVGLGIVPVNELARRYRDLLGRVNATFAAHADRSFFVVAGRGVRLDGVTPA